MKIAQLYRLPGHLIRRANQISGAVFAEILAEHQITSVQYAALTVIAEDPGITAARLSDAIAFDRATLGGVVDRLETKGLVVRAGSGGDRRIKTLTLTEQGSALLAAVEPLVLQVQAQILDPLPAEDRAQLVALLAKLVRLHADDPADASTDSRSSQPV